MRRKPGTSIPNFLNPRNAGRNLERILDERGISQNALAGKTEIQQEAVNRAIKTGRGLSMERWQTIANYLEIPVETIFGVQPIPPTEKTLAEI